MKRILLVGLCALSSFATLACDFPEVKFQHDFAAARLDECKQLNDSTYQLTLIPENTPINDSPWYAFKVIADKPAEIKVVMKVVDGTHRYPPKVSQDGHNWQLQKYRLRKNKMSFHLSVSDNPTWISAQEILTNDQYYQWGKYLAQQQHISQEVLGNSTQKRPIYKIETKGEGKDWLVILGRQHPPEVTGALAIFPFTETLLSESKLAQKFRKQFNVLVVPNLNPDGVQLGNWRHNANGIDLNRSWKKFDQIESKHVDDYLTELVGENQKMRMAVDFHSTNKDIFYTMPSDYGMNQPYLVETWLNSLDKQYPDFTVIQKPGNNPGKGVFKQYFTDKYKAHAITYEMGDNTDRKFINTLAVSAANTLMTTLLNSDPVTGK